MKLVGSNADEKMMRKKGMELGRKKTHMRRR